MQPHPFDTPPQANLCASTAAEMLLWCSNTLPLKNSWSPAISSVFSCYFFPSPIFLLAQLSFCFLSVLQNVHFQKTETRAEKYCVTYTLFNYVKRCITKSASKHLTNIQYTTRLQYIFFFSFSFFCCVQTHSLLIICWKIFFFLSLPIVRPMCFVIREHLLRSEPFLYMH